MVGCVTFIAGGEGRAVEALAEGAELAQLGGGVEEVLVGFIALRTGGER